MKPARTTIQTNAPSIAAAEQGEDQAIFSSGLTRPTPKESTKDKLSVPSVETIARHYDSLDYFYRDIWGEHIHHGLWLTGRESPAEAADQMSRRVLERLELTQGSNLADIGCGYGATARIAAAAYGANVIGFTISAAQKTYADERTVARGSVETRLQDWAESDLTVGSFDALLSLESIEHMADRMSFARQARRVLRPGGKMVICTWLAAENMSAWSQRHLLEPIAREGRQAPLVTSRELRSLLNAAGFAEVRVEDLTLQVKRTWSVVIRRMLLRVLTRPRYWRLMLNSSASDRIFAITACRILVAYQTGSMRFALFTCR
jgi:tocopherol O-methyltransferase